MNMYSKYRSPLGYYNNDNQIDSYGVNHSGFSARDELNYQMARQQREDAMMQCCNNQRITSNYPQYTTNFGAIQRMIIMALAILISKATWKMS